MARRLTSTAPTISIDMSLRLMEARISTPRPPAPMVAAMVITPMFMTTAVRTPARITGTAIATLAGPLQASATVLLTVPSIALFGLLLPFYSKFGQGLGPMPAITAVFLYSLLPIMRNTYLALTGVEPGIREAAKGIGMTFGQRLRMVEL